MSNVLYANPLALDTDFASYQAIQTLTAASELLGLKIKKFSLYAGSATSAGTVTVTDPTTGRALLAPMNVSVGQAAGTILFYDDFESQPVWTDFAVTGLTATGTKLLVWFGR